MSGYLVFIDTNILLDFYRVRKESSLGLLKELDKLHDHLITTYQVEMEFKKNRQAAILESLKNLKTREAIPHPAFLAETRAASILSRRHDDINTRIKRVQDRLKKVLAKPTTSDPVYKVIQRLFIDNTSLNLTRSTAERRTIKRRAWRRFVLGYPPRKQSDTSMGDALNWEWIIHIAAETGKHVAIVSRDSDYGVELDGTNYINDWLIQEFRDIVSKKRQLQLFSRLSPALKLLEVQVQPEAEEEERELAQQRKRVSNRAWTPTLAWLEEVRKVFEEEANFESFEEGDA